MVLSLDYLFNMSKFSNDLYLNDSNIISKKNNIILKKDNDNLNENTQIDYYTTLFTLGEGEDTIKINSNKIELEATPEIFNQLIYNINEEPQNIYYNLLTFITFDRNMDAMKTPVIIYKLAFDHNFSNPDINIKSISDILDTTPLEYSKKLSILVALYKRTQLKTYKDLHSEYKELIDIIVKK